MKKRKWRTNNAAVLAISPTTRRREDYELAQSIHGEMLELRARANSATSVELSVIAAKAEIARGLAGLRSRATVDDAGT